MAVETLLVRGVAQALATAGVGTWSTTTPYTASQTGIYDGPVGSTTPEGVGLATYPVSDPVDSEATIGLQVTIRSATKAALRDRAELIFTTLHAAWGLQLSGLRIDQALRRSSADLGTDDAGRYLRTDNYYIQCNQPTPNRL